jgi:pyruvate dehydrogenase E1 component alpha subunit
MHYRAKEEVARFRESMDCLKNFMRHVTSAGWLSDADLDAIDQEVAATIDRSVETARSAVPPSASDLLDDVYVAY